MAKSLKFNVHIYAVARVKVCDIEAASQIEAIAKAQALVDINRAIHNDNPGGGANEVEYAEEIEGFLVDNVGDEDFSATRLYKDDGITVDTGQS